MAMTVPWPKIVHAVADPSYPNEGIALYKENLPRGVEESNDLEVRTYIPAPSPSTHQDSPKVPKAAVEALYESMHGLYRPWSRLEPKKKAGWEHIQVVDRAEAERKIDQARSEGAEEERERLRAIVARFHNDAVRSKIVAEEQGEDSYVASVRIGELREVLAALDQKGPDHG